MWGSRKRTTDRMRGRLSAFLDEGSEFEGKYTCTGTIVLDAKLRGEIVSHGTLVIGERGRVHAAVHAETLIVRGELVGTVTATERVELMPTARVIGDIEAPVILMEAGAVHDGHSRMAKAQDADARPEGVVVPLKGVS
jgi:cytoskeletal protein CcmA (bactofilin family)